MMFFNRVRPPAAEFRIGHETETGATESRTTPDLFGMFCVSTYLTVFVLRISNARICAPKKPAQANAGAPLLRAVYAQFSHLRATAHCRTSSTHISYHTNLETHPLPASARQKRWNGKRFDFVLNSRRVCVCKSIPN